MDEKGGGQDVTIEALKMQFQGCNVLSMSWDYDTSVRGFWGDPWQLPAGGPLMTPLEGP